MKPEQIVEVIGDLEPKLHDDLVGKRAYFGFEPSGRLHRGILNPVVALQWVTGFGATPIVLVADSLSKLNGKTLHPWDALLQHLPKSTEVILQSQVYDGMRKPSALECLMELSQIATAKRTVCAIDCAGRESAEADELSGIRMSPLVYTLMQCVDMHLLDVDIAIGGTDQRKAHMLARDCFPKLGWKVPTMVHTSILLDRKGRKMSKSNPETCEWLDSSPSTPLPTMEN